MLTIIIEISRTIFYPKLNSGAIAVPIIINYKVSYEYLKMNKIEG